MQMTFIFQKPSWEWVICGWIQFFRISCFGHVTAASSVHACTSARRRTRCGCSAAGPLWPEGCLQHKQDWPFSWEEEFFTTDCGIDAVGGYGAANLISYGSLARDTVLAWPRHISRPRLSDYLLKVRKLKKFWFLSFSKKNNEIYLNSALSIENVV